MSRTPERGAPRRRPAPAVPRRKSPPPPAPRSRLYEGRWTLASVVGLLGLLLLVSLTAPRWAELLRRPLPDAPGEEPEPIESVPDPGLASGGSAERRIRVKLFLGHPEQRALVEEEREIPFSADIAGQVRAVVESLIEGSQGELLPVLPPSARVLDVFVRGGVAYVNLSAETSGEHEGGSVAELVTVYAVVNSVTVNFPAVRKVQIVIDGQGRSSLAGHVDISSPLGPDLALLAPAPLSGDEGSPAAGGPGQGQGQGQGEEGNR